MWRNTSFVTWALSLGLVASFWVASLSLKATGILWDTNGDYEFCVTSFCFLNIFKSKYLSSNSHSGTGMSGSFSVKSWTINLQGSWQTFWNVHIKIPSSRDDLIYMGSLFCYDTSAHRSKSCKAPRAFKITLIRGEVHPGPHWTAAGWLPACSRTRSAVSGPGGEHPQGWECHTALLRPVGAALLRQSYCPLRYRPGQWWQRKDVKIKDIMFPCSLL